MTGQPDIGAARAYVEEMMRAGALALAALRGEGGGELFISTDSAAKHGRFDAASAAGVAEGVDREPWTVIRDIPAGDPGNFAGKAILAGTVLYRFRLPTYGAVDTQAGIALSERPGEYPFFQFPRDAVVEGAAGVAGGAEPGDVPGDVPPLSKPWRLDLHICGVRFEMSAPPNCPDATVHHASPIETPGDGA